MPFVKVPEQFAKTASLKDIAVYTAIKKHSDNKTGICFPSQKKIAEILNISESTVKRSVKSLKDLDVVSIVAKHKPNSREINNYYTFDLLETNYITVDVKIFSLNLSCEFIGLLIKLRSLTYENSLRINFNKEKIASLCGIGKAKLNKYLNNDLINYSNSVLELSDSIFQDNSSKAVKFRNKSKIIKSKKEALIKYADSILKHSPDSKEAKSIRYYFLSENKKVNHPLSLLSKIVYGVSYKKSAPSNQTLNYIL